MSSTIASKVAGPSRSSVTRLPLETSAAAMRHRPRANDGPGATGKSRAAAHSRARGLGSSRSRFRLACLLHADTAELRPKALASRLGSRPSQPIAGARRMAIDSYIAANAQHRSHRTARARRGRGRRRRVRLRDRQGAGRSGRERLRRHVAAGAQHLPQPARARKDGRVAPSCRRASC